MTATVVEAEWLWATDITVEHEEAKAEENAKYADKLKELWRKSACIDCKTANCNDEQARRVMSYASIDTAALPEDKYKTVILLNYYHSVNFAFVSNSVWNCSSSDGINLLDC